MHLVVIGLLALVAGVIYNYAVPRIEPLLPASVSGSSNFFVKSLVTGVFLVAVLWAASTVLGMLGQKARV